MKLAFLGLGAMGQRMIKHLVDTEYSLSVWNRTLETAHQFIKDLKMDDSVAETPAKACEGADIVISMLSDDIASQNTWDGQHGALSAIESGALVIECSTLSTDWIQSLGKSCDSKGIELIDAPVVGSLPQAEAAALHFFIGGSESAFSRALPVLKKMGQQQHHLGDLGAGTTTKLINNAFLSIQVASIAELLSVLERTKTDTSNAFDAILQTPLASPVSKIISKLIQENNHASLFPVELMDKDLRYFHALQSDISTPMTQASHQVFSQAVANGYGKLNMTAVAKLFSK